MSNAFSRLILAMTLGLSVTVPAVANDGVAGPYLAGRSAAGQYDYRAASQYYTRALISEPQNGDFLENAIIAQIALGAFDRTAPMVAQMNALGAEAQGANLMTMATLARDEDWTQLLAEIAAGRSSGVLVDGLIKAWAMLGQGQMSDAALAFDEVAKDDGLKTFALYHKALALASVGDFEAADAIFSGESGGPLRMTRRGVFAHAQVLSQLERNSDALDLIQTVFGDDPDPAIALLKADLKAGKPVPFDVATGARDGVAEVFFTVASALSAENADFYTLAYARLGHFIRPGHTDAILLSAQLLERQDQFDLATEAYNLIPAESASYHAAELGRAEALVRAGKTDAAIEVLQNLGKLHPDMPTIWSSLGDTLRREERFPEAIAAYDKAVTIFTAPQPAQWVIYYARGIAYEREKVWDKAVADFRKALELQPDQPQVLNYLGYGFLEKGENLDEALSMIERAVAARPQDGYIVDSLGWALYRLGRYDEAVAPMEQAIQLMPIDPVVNDHLGDVYWAVGRELEAAFQWRRALSFEPESEAEATRIRRKIEVGLDAVLKEEGAQPLSVSENVAD